MATYAVVTGPQDKLRHHCRTRRDAQRWIAKFGRKGVYYKIRCLPRGYWSAF